MNSGETARVPEKGPKAPADSEKPPMDFQIGGCPESVGKSSSQRRAPSVPTGAETGEPMTASLDFKAWKPGSGKPGGFFRGLAV